MCVLGAAFNPVVGVGQRRFKIVADLFVELVVLLGRDVFLGARPDGVALVGGFPLAGLDHATGLAAAFFVAWVDQFAVFPFFLFHQNGQADVVRVLGDDALDFPGAGVVQRVVAQVQDDAGATLGTVDGFDLKVARAAADPAHAFGRLHASPAGFDGDLVGHDKAGIKTDAKLANQLRVGLLVARELAHEVFGAALGDGAEVVDGLLRAHADAVVGDGQRLGVFVEGDLDFELRVAFVQATVVDGFKTQLVAGVRGIGDQFAQKNLFVGVKRVGDEVQQLRHFSLEGKGLFGHGMSR